METISYKLESCKADDFIYKVKFYCKSIDLVKTSHIENETEVTIHIVDAQYSEFNKTLLENIYNEIISQPKYRSHIIYDSGVQSLCKENVYKDILSNDIVHEFSLGRISYNNIFLILTKYFDLQFLKLAEQLGAIDTIYPTFLKSTDLDKCNYISSFPQYLNFVSHLEHDVEKIKKYVQERDRVYFNKDQYVLSPALCLNCYIQMEGRKLIKDKPVTITTKGKCFRYESNNLCSPYRLWEFTMREIVFVGNEEYVESKRQECMDFIVKLIERLKVSAFIENAGDPFFTDAGGVKAFQLLTKLKYEVRMRIPFSDTSIAVGSFNFHKDHFGKSYNIKAEEDFAFTSCTGFGLERWAYAFLMQYGLDTRNWPGEIQEFVNLFHHY